MADGAMQKLIDGARFSKLADWSPSVAIQSGIDETVNWYCASLEKELSHAHWGSGYLT